MTLLHSSSGSSNGTVSSHRVFKRSSRPCAARKKLDKPVSTISAWVDAGLRVVAMDLVPAAVLSMHPLKH